MNLSFWPSPDCRWFLSPPKGPFWAWKNPDGATFSLQLGLTVNFLEPLKFKRPVVLGNLWTLPYRMFCIFTYYLYRFPWLTLQKQNKNCSSSLVTDSRHIPERPRSQSKVDWNKDEASWEFPGWCKCSATSLCSSYVVKNIWMNLSSWKPTGSLACLASLAWLLPFSSSSRRLRHQEPVESDAGALCRAAGPGGGGPEGQPHHQGHAHISRGRQRNSHQVRGLPHTSRPAPARVSVLLGFVVPGTKITTIISFKASKSGFEFHIYWVNLLDVCTFTLKMVQGKSHDFK